MTFHRITAIFLLAATAAIIEPASATIVLEQPGVVFGSGFGSGYINYHDGSNYVVGEARGFDDFRLSATHVITKVSWLGGATPAENTFTIGFTTDEPLYATYWSPFPNFSLFSNQTVTPTMTAVPGASWEGFYTATLPAPVTLLGGTNYWITIYNPNNGWEWNDASSAPSPGSLGAGVAAGYVDVPFVGPPLRELRAGDLNFTLESTAVPEPATLLLFVAGLLIPLRRNKRSG